MLSIVVPLAGSDFYSKEFGIRPLYPVGGSTLIEYVLRKRPWLAHKDAGGTQLIFVLREEEPHSELFKQFIKTRFPEADIVLLSKLTAGAPFSALAGVALVRNPSCPVVVDLADISFETDFDPDLYFQKSAAVQAVVPYFISSNPKFSYLKLDGIKVVMAREKQVISENASAGLYCFRNVDCYLEAVKYSIGHPEICKVGSPYFVCPSITAFLDKGEEVHGIRVRNAEPIGEIFHVTPN